MMPMAAQDERHAGMVAYATDAMSRGEYELAERVAREVLAEGGRLPEAWELIAETALRVSRPDIALGAIEKAEALRASPAPATAALRARALIPAKPSPAGNDRYHIIRSWAQGFWSDVDHVMGQLLVAEITGRKPLVHWGANSRFRDATETGDANAWESFFEPVSSVKIAEITDRGLAYFPPKWNDANLTIGDNGAFHGPHSRIAALDFFAREEAVTVSDFHAPMLALTHWIPREHRLHSKPVSRVFMDLMRKYLKPKREFLTRADTFAGKHLSKPTIAVHVRGSDKAKELGDLSAAAALYHQAIASLSPLMGGKPKILLVTDWAPAEAEYRARYGDRVIVSEATKTSLSTGLHFQPSLIGRKLGEEVLMDALIAARCHAFVGLAYSNVSAFIGYLGRLTKGWDDSRAIQIGPSIHGVYNSFLLKRS
ncbi:MAG: hypothetical protein JNM86_16555 [Phycisphaerae bacterium]|nr:hypothetical protein [Phycisphaerae bacterium]